jgi:hypothetical protein
MQSFPSSFEEPHLSSTRMHAHAWYGEHGATMIKLDLRFARAADRHPLVGGEPADHGDRKAVESR